MAHLICNNIATESTFFITFLSACGNLNIVRDFLISRMSIIFHGGGVTWGLIVIFLRFLLLVVAGGRVDGFRFVGRCRSCVGRHRMVIRGLTGVTRSGV